MTVTAITTRVPAQRTADTLSTPESQRVAELEAMLADPAYAGWKKELEAAHAELVRLIATTALAA